MKPLAVKRYEIDALQIRRGWADLSERSLTERRNLLAFEGSHPLRSRLSSMALPNSGLFRPHTALRPQCAAPPSRVERGGLAAIAIGR